MAGGLLSQMLHGLGHVLVPRLCAVCGASLTATEQVMCLQCLCDLPRTSVHTDDFNEIHRRLGHHCVVHRAAGWFWYAKGNPYTRLILDAKYGGLQLQGRRLGRMCAAELKPDAFFDGIDLIVPMPMPWLKRWRRGYNQAREIALGVSDVTGIPVSDALRAVRSHGVQSRHSRATRFSNITDTMAVSDPAALSGRHLLLIDDIITTGASMTEAFRAIAPASPAAVSVLCLGLTQRNY